MSLPLIEPVLRDDCAPVDDGFVEDGFVEDGLVDDGLVDEGYDDDDPIPAIELSRVPFTSTLWLRYLDQLELLLPFAIKLMVLGMLADDPVVPAVPVAELEELDELCVASFRTNFSPDILRVDELDELDEGEPVVPVADELELSPLCRHPVRVTC